VIHISTLGVARRSRRNVTIRTLSVAALLVAPLALSGCGVKDSTKSAASGSTSDCKRSTEKTIGFDFPLNTLAVYKNLQHFIDQEAQIRGYTVKYTADNSNLQQQTTNLQTWLTQKIPAIVSYPLEPASIEPIAAQARAQCTVFVSYAGEMKNQDASLQFNTFQSGVLLGQNALGWAAKQSKPVKVLILNDKDLTAGQQREAGLLSVFPGGAKNIQVIGDQKAGDQQTGESVTATVLQAHPDLNMVLAYDDDVALGAQQAFLNAGKSGTDPNIYVGGQDGSQAGLRALQKGGIYRCSVAVRIKTFAAAVADVPIDILQGKDNKGVNVTPVPLTSSDPRLAEFLSDYS
jgi:ribose transport system substrate-binding protein